MENVKTNIDLTEFGISNYASHALRDLLKIYPRSYDVRNSIFDSIPVFKGNRNGVVYIINQDCEDHYPYKHYVLWDGVSFNEICRESPEEKSLIASNGVFLFNTESVSLYHQDEKNGKRILFLSDQHRNNIGTIESIKLSPEGLYLFGEKMYEKRRIGFLQKNEEGSFDKDTDLKVIEFPDWVHMDTVQPGVLNSTFFSDLSTSIYAVDNKNGVVKMVYSSQDPNIRFNEYRWSLYSTPKDAEDLPIFMFIPRDTKSRNDSYLSDGTILPEEVAYNKDSIVQVGDGFVSLFYNGCHDLSLTYHWSPEGIWQKKIFYEKNISFQKRPVIRPADDTSFFLGMGEGVWRRIPIEEVIG